MAKYFIEDVKFGDADVNELSGPSDLSLIIEARVRSEDGDVFYASKQESYGVPFLCRSDYSLFDEEHADDYESFEYGSEWYDGGESGYDYIFQDDDLAEREVQLYMLCLMYAAPEEASAFVAQTKGKWLDVSQIPLMDVERDYMQRMEEEGRPEYNEAYLKFRRGL